MAHDVRTDVLVVGGGLVGLAAAGLLAGAGAGVVLAERHPSTSRHPKARLANVRSMEVYRALGVEERLLELGEPPPGFVLAETLADQHATWVPPPEEGEPGGDLSPCLPWSCDQQLVEPVLRARAVELGAELRFSSPVTELVPVADGMSARVGAETVDARYVVVADGANGGLRAQLGIDRHGEPVAGTAVSAVFRADLSAALRGRTVGALMARAAGAFLFARGTTAERSWQLGTHLRPDWDVEKLHEHVVEVIRDATGLPDLVPDVEDVRTWTTGAYVADRLRSGRAFLVGDAAHVMPPYGGFGGNTGVQDAHNLAWKLAAVCRGDAPETLLDSYAAERAPIAELTVAQALLRSRSSPGAPPLPGRIEAPELFLGFRYAGGAPEDPARPSGDPGTRAAHVGLVGLARGRSTLDLVDPARHVVIGGPDARTRDGAALRVVAPDQVVPAHRTRWDAVYGGAGALVRPDGVLAAGVPI